MSERLRLPLAGRTLGIVGVGNVGRRVLARAGALGLSTLCCDPPRARAGEKGFVSLETVLAGADFVTLHVPLAKEGQDPTFELADERFFAAWRGGGKGGRLFLNASRGGVVAEGALRAAIDDGRVAGAALDVWRGEPAIAADTLRRATLATPHIAGYSFDGKVAGTRMIYEAACRHFGRTPSWDPAPLLPAPTVPEIVDRPAAGEAPEAALRRIVRRVYDIEADDAALRATLPMAADERGARFTRLRKEYPARREFRFTRVRGAAPELSPALAALDFATDR